MPIIYCDIHLQTYRHDMTYSVLKVPLNPNQPTITYSFSSKFAVNFYLFILPRSMSPVRTHCVSPLKWYNVSNRKIHFWCPKARFGSCILPADVKNTSIT